MSYSPRKLIKYTFISLMVILIAFAIMHSVGVFNKEDYAVLPHGNHNHYLPHDRDPNVPVHSFPQRPPGPGERITPQGQIVRDP